MFYLGNILTDGQISDREFLNVVKDEKDLIDGLPTLIVGWDKVKAMYPEASIIDWRIDENTFWTYGRREKRDRYEENLKKYREYLLERATQTVNYQFFNVFTKSKDEKRRLFSQIKDDADKYILLSRDMVFMYVPGSGVTIGLSLEQVDYEGGDRKKFLGAMFGNPHNKVIKERDYSSKEVKRMVRDNRYVIPYLASLSD